MKNHVFLIVILAIAGVGGKMVYDKMPDRSAAIARADRNRAIYAKACELFRETLIAPSTAVFPDEPLGVTEKEGGVYLVAHVDSQNVFGAQVRQKWWATALPAEKTGWEIEVTALK